MVLRIHGLKVYVIVFVGFQWFRRLEVIVLCNSVIIIHGVLTPCYHVVVIVIGTKRAAELLTASKFSPTVGRPTEYPTPLWILIIILLYYYQCNEFVTAVRRVRVFSHKIRFSALMEGIGFLGACRRRTEYIHSRWIAYIIILTRVCFRANRKTKIN